MALGADLLALPASRPRPCGRSGAKRALASGAAAERFERMVAGLGGPTNFVSRAHALLPRTPVLVDATPEARGFVEGIDVRAIGLAVVELGGGRARAADAIDPAVGLTELAPVGAEVSPAARSPACTRATSLKPRRRRSAFAPPIDSAKRRSRPPTRCSNGSLERRETARPRRVENGAAMSVDQLVFCAIALLIASTSFLKESKSYILPFNSVLHLRVNAAAATASLIWSSLAPSRLAFMVWA